MTAAIRVFRRSTPTEEAAAASDPGRGSSETLLADATRFAEAAGAADSPVTLEIWPHMIHAWPLWNARLEAGRQAIASAGAFIRRHL